MEKDILVIFGLVRDIFKYNKGKKITDKILALKLITVKNIFIISKF